MPRYEVAHVVNVVDGDTFQIEDGRYVRILGINAPEHDEKYFEAAKDALEAYISDKDVYLERSGQDKDKYGRLLRSVILENGTNVGVELVRSGLAVIYITSKSYKYANALEAAQRECVENGVNLCKKSEERCGNCIRIKSLVRIGEEYIEIENKCNFTCDVDGWYIRDSADNKYFLNSCTKTITSSIKIFSGHGEQNSTHCYWNSKYPIWNDEYDVAYLKDASGDLVDYFISKS